MMDEIESVNETKEKRKWCLSLSLSARTHTRKHLEQFECLFLLYGFQICVRRSGWL